MSRYLLLFVLWGVLWGLLFGAGCAAKKEVDLAEKLFTSNLKPFDTQQLKPISRWKLDRIGLYDWLNRTIFFRQPAKTYSKFRYYNVARGLYEGNTIDIFENSQLQGKAASILKIFVHPNDPDHYYVKARLHESGDIAYVLIDVKEHVLENICFEDVKTEAEGFLGKNVWRNPSQKLWPLIDGVRAKAPLTQFHHWEVLSVDTTIYDEASETCGIRVVLGEGKEQTITCYRKGLLMGGDLKRAYPDVTSNDWKLVREQRLGEGMTAAGVLLSWGEPTKKFRATHKGKRTDAWAYGEDTIYFVDGKVFDWIQK